MVEISIDRLYDASHRGRHALVRCTTGEHRGGRTKKLARDRRLLQYYRVAARLGYRTPGDLIDDLGLDEVNRWVAVADLDGWGEESILLARLVGMQINKPVCDILDGWAWARERNGR